ncbi:MAG: FAD-binding oxidoreductase [Saprospiraceae bacterium]|nr:FAD-binding oxidoreductase [Saprospiraceae bacterium]
MPWKWYDSTVIDIQEIGPKTRIFRLRIEDDPPLQFTAGQFVTVDLPIHMKRLRRWRSYSIANPPDNSNIIELCIVYLEGGLASEYLFHEVKVGTEIKFKGPSGTFTLPQKLDHDCIMICTGTGVAPFRSMLLDLQQRKAFTRAVHLIFGTRYQDGILYQEKFEELASQVANFTYSVTLSRDNQWKGNKGYVHEIYMRKYAQPVSDRVFYLCGWSSMIDEAVIHLWSELGYDKSQIKYELYG